MRAAQDSSRRETTLIGLSYLILGLVDPNWGILQLPLQWLLKQKLQFGPDQLAGFFAVAMIPWYFKPIAGILGDSVGVSEGRQHLLPTFGACAAGLACLALGLLAEQRWSLLVGVLAINIALMFVSTLTGGLLVREGQRLGATDQFTSARSACESIASLLAGPIGGLSAGLVLLWPTTGCAILIFVLAAAFWSMAANRRSMPAEAHRTLQEQIRFSFTLFSARNVWIAGGIFLLYQIAPGFQTPLFYRQTDQLHFSPEFIGLLSSLSAMAGIVGAVLYAFVCRRLTFRIVFPVAVTVSAAAAFAHVLYADEWSAITIDICNGLFGTCAFVAILDFIARCIPRDHGTLGYAFIFSVGNLASGASDVIGSYWYSHGASFTSLVSLNVCTTLIILLLVPFLPTRLLAKSEKQLAVS